jgi:hypothetical protein
MTSLEFGAGSPARYADAGRPQVGRLVGVAGRVPRGTCSGRRAPSASVGSPSTQLCEARIVASEERVLDGLITAHSAMQSRSGPPPAGFGGRADRSHRPRRRPEIALPPASMTPFGQPGLGEGGRPARRRGGLGRGRGAGRGGGVAAGVEVQASLSRLSVGGWRSRLASGCVVVCTGVGVAVGVGARRTRVAEAQAARGSVSTSGKACRMRFDPAQP